MMTGDLHRTERGVRSSVREVRFFAHWIAELCPSGSNPSSTDQAPNDMGLDGGIRVLRDESSLEFLLAPDTIERCRLIAGLAPMPRNEGHHFGCISDGF
jgi:hypothetical protein